MVPQKWELYFDKQEAEAAAEAEAAVSLAAKAAAEKETFEAANAEAAAVCSLDGYRRRSRHDSKQRNKVWLD